MKLVGLVLVITGLGYAQTYTPRESRPFDANPPTASGFKGSAASVRPTDMVFPHMAIGGGWETILVIVNMSAQTVTFDQFFYDVFGRSLPVTFRTVPDNRLLTTSAAHGVLQPGGSFNILLFDSGQPLTVGWSLLSYDSTTNRLGGYSIFRLLARSGRSTDFEALVPLSSTDDYKFFMPFDNLQGFITSMALVNPGSTDTLVTFRILDSSGALLGTYTRRLFAGNQTAFVLRDEFPETRNTTGVIYVEGSTGSLSALGFRFNAGLAFATIPIMNWPGMFYFCGVRMPRAC